MTEVMREQRWFPDWSQLQANLGDLINVTSVSDAPGVTVYRAIISGAQYRVRERSDEWQKVAT